MKTGIAIIGAGFGDEGKGLMVDYLTRTKKSNLVCRFNGGAQAGHTVETVDPIPRRHVFGHVAAGAFNNAITYLSSKFIVNPWAFIREFDELEKLEVRPIVIVHPAAKVTTGYDVLINSALERSRGNNRHGSCGMGINETVTRGLAGFGIPIKVLKYSTTVEIAGYLQMIKKEWVLPRIRQLNIPIRDYLTAEELQFLDANANSSMADNMQSAVADLELASPIDLYYEKQNAPIIFEGAQGLALDEFLGEFPHVTRSVTGLLGAIEAARELGVEKLKPVYVTRCYATRHGAGKLSREGEMISAETLTDNTNKFNFWQEGIRYAPLDLGELDRFITADLARCEHISIYEKPVIAITCLDQVGRNVRMYDKSGSLHEVRTENVSSCIERELGLKVKYVSYGPKSTDVRKLF
jgi:adenylosuccinate synthase